LIFGRKRELIIRGAYDVLPGEIEEILSGRLAVRGVAVVGVAHPEFGEDVGAAVAVKAGAGVAGNGIRDQFRTTVDSYECSQAACGLSMSCRRLELPM
jgi:long-chain acyl-CoA synthetase